MREKLMKAMLQRKSIRVYLEKQLSKGQISDIKSYISTADNYTCPFGSDVRIDLLEHGNVDTKGVIKNAPVYVVVVIKNNVQALIDAGFVFENFVLFIETLDLSTCYLNSGFKRESVVLNKPLESDEIMIVASPIGFASEKKSLLDRGSKLFLKSGNRKDIDEMFYSDFDKAPVVDNAIREKLEYVRWAPSAINSQPWRIVFEDEKAHFYINEKQYNSKRADYNIHILDIGIALSHYSIIFDRYNFYVDESVKECGGMKYLLSVD